ncbi:hypothetical protein HMPREF9065_01622 [Aggregatibacter sp. oral taxon 458 str. W10330]|nr:hypothetical protein HMPREF9065_01622 [Aggregatibacter sp. oral taxon 458 str. W10330]
MKLVKKYITETKKAINKKLAFCYRTFCVIDRYFNKSSFLA